MITEDGVEYPDDFQAQDAGDEDPNYAVPFGVPEDKAGSLGFKDPRVIEPPPWRDVRPTRLQRIERWIRLRVFRQRR